MSTDTHGRRRAVFAPATKHSATFLRLWDESPITEQPAYVPLSNEQIDKILDSERMRWATSPPTYEYPHAVCRAIESFVVARMKGTS